MFVKCQVITNSLASSISQDNALSKPLYLGKNEPPLLFTVEMSSKGTGPASGFSGSELFSYLQLLIVYFLPVLCLGLGCKLGKRKKLCHGIMSCLGWADKGLGGLGEQLQKIWHECCGLARNEWELCHWEERGIYCWGTAMLSRWQSLCIATEAAGAEGSTIPASSLPGCHDVGQVPLSLGESLPLGAEPLLLLISTGGVTEKGRSNMRVQEKTFPLISTWEERSGNPLAISNL